VYFTRYQWTWKKKLDLVFLVDLGLKWLAILGLNGWKFWLVICWEWMQKGRSCGGCLVVDVTRFKGIWVGWRERIVATGSRDGKILRLIVWWFMVGWWFIWRNDGGWFTMGKERRLFWWLYKWEIATWF